MKMRRTWKRFLAIIFMYFTFQYLIQFYTKIQGFWCRIMLSPPPLIDPLRATALDLQKLLASGRITTELVVDSYLAQIERHNHKGLKLNSIITTASRESLARQAAILDQERKLGKLRSPLHGIPIIVKDTIFTSAPDLPTTLGSFAFVNARVRKNADVINTLVEAGLIILGKANMSELGNCKGSGLTAGWSAVGGQTQTPYVVGGVVKGDKWLGYTTPAGSSAGSAVGVAAGFSPLSIGSDTDGSLVQPAHRAALFSIKITAGNISTEGVLPGSPWLDSLGPMAKTSADMAAIMGVLLKGRDFKSSLTLSWAGLKIGFLKPELWDISPAVCIRDEGSDRQKRVEIEAAMDKIAAIANTKRYIDFPVQTPETMNAMDNPVTHDFSKCLEQFLTGYENSEIRTVKDLVDFNKANDDRELPADESNQDFLELLLTNPVSDAEYDSNIAHFKKELVENGFKKIMAEHNIDVIMGPLDSRLCSVAGAARYPCGTLPLGYLDNTTKPFGGGRPFGMAVITAPGKEDKIVQVMSAWEATIAKWQPPPQMLKL